MIRELVVVFLLAIILSCAKNKPTPTISYDRMVNIVVDLYVAEEISRDFPIAFRDSINIVLIESLHKVHNTTQAELDSNLYLYETDYEVYQELLKEVKERLDSLSNSSIPKEINKYSEEK